MRLEELSIAPYRVTVPRGIDSGRTRRDRARFAIRRRGGIRDAAFPRFLLHRYPPCFAIVIIARRDLRFCAIAATGVIPDVIPERRPSAKAPQLRGSSGLFGRTSRTSCVEPHRPLGRIVLLRRSVTIASPPPTPAVRYRPSKGDARCSRRVARALFKISCAAILTVNAQSYIKAT